MPPFFTGISRSAGGVSFSKGISRPSILGSIGISKTTVGAAYTQISINALNSFDGPIDTYDYKISANIPSSGIVSTLYPLGKSFSSLSGIGGTITNVSVAGTNIELTFSTPNGLNNFFQGDRIYRNDASQPTIDYPAYCTGVATVFGSNISGLGNLFDDDDNSFCNLYENGGVQILKFTPPSPFTGVTTARIRVSSSAGGERRFIINNGQYSGVIGAGLAKTWIGIGTGTSAGTISTITIYHNTNGACCRSTQIYSIEINGSTLVALPSISGIVTSVDLTNNKIGISYTTGNWNNSTSGSYYIINQEVSKVLGLNTSYSSINGYPTLETITDPIAVGWGITVAVGMDTNKFLNNSLSFYPFANSYTGLTTNTKLTVDCFFKCDNYTISGNPAGMALFILGNEGASDDTNNTISFGICTSKWSYGWGWNMNSQNANQSFTGGRGVGWYDTGVTADNNWHHLRMSNTGLWLDGVDISVAGKKPVLPFRWYQTRNGYLGYIEGSPYDNTRNYWHGKISNFRLILGDDLGAPPSNLSTLLPFTTKNSSGQIEIPAANVYLIDNGSSGITTGTKTPPSDNFVPSPSKTLNFDQPITYPVGVTTSASQLLSSAVITSTVTAKNILGQVSIASTFTLF
jgi:hypothetical protein